MRPVIVGRVRGIAAQLRESLEAFRNNFRNRELRRLQLGLTGSVVGEWAFTVALAVYAFEQGGATTVGLVALVRTIPAALAAPFTGLIGDRFRRERVMLVSDLLRCALTAGAAAAALGGAPVVVYACAVLISLVGRVFLPAQAALLPTLAKTPDELTAANVVSSTIEAVGLFAGPAIGGLLLAATSAGWVFVFTSVTFLWSASFIVRIHADYEPRAPEEHGILREALAGFETLGREPRLRLLVGIFGAQTLVAGALTVLLVVTAIDLLDIGKSGVGFLNSALGVGGLIGAVAAMLLVGRRRLAGGFALGILLWGFPLALIGVWPSPAVALVMLGLLGLGNTIVDVAGLTMLQRAVPDSVLARAMAVMEMIFIGTIGIGSILAPALISLVGIRWALVATGLFLPALVALFWTRLLAIDAETVVPEEQLELLRGIPIFAPLPPAPLEHLAANLQRVSFPGGSVIFRQGDEGDRFYVIEQGEVEISVDGAAPKVEGRGGYFGEIALLREVPRTASVSARTDVELYALDRDEFIGAVTGHAPSAEAADSVIGARLGTLRPGVVSV
jgi:MFS family permease